MALAVQQHKKEASDKKAAKKQGKVSCLHEKMQSAMKRTENHGWKLKTTKKTITKNPKEFYYKTGVYLGAKKFHFSKYKKIFQRGLFHFSSLESHFLKYKTKFRVSASWNIKKFCFLKYKKNFLLRNCKILLNIRAKKFHFLKYKKI